MIMVTILLIASIATLFAASLGVVIRQKASALRDLYEDEAALTAQSLDRKSGAGRTTQSASTRVRNIAISRRKVQHACGNHAHA
jgi:hypothetical protein